MWWDEFWILITIFKVASHHCHVWQIYVVHGIPQPNLNCPLYIIAMFFSRCDGLCIGNCTWHHITAICDKCFDMEGVWLRAIKAWMDLFTFCLCSWHVLWMALHWFTKLLCATNFSGMYFWRYISLFPHRWYVLKSKQLETIEDLNFSFYIQCLFFQQFILKNCAQFWSALCTVLVRDKFIFAHCSKFYFNLNV